ncbi:MAG: cytochrome c-type biogenesis protein CcmH [Gammaproteobacteria bacterium]|nr:cytochrome c-type biogenesis protein CcmH [Gammaproteobacteria bacterium]
MKRLIIVLSLFISLTTLEAAVEVKTFESQQQELRYKKLIEELRCLVCQNQNLAGSDAGLAQDLRKQVYKMIRAGNSDEEILDFMVTRYGDFVLYRPPFKATTFLLWIGPFIILAIGMLVLIRFIRQRKNVVVTTITNNDKEKLKQLLDEDKEQDK